MTVGAKASALVVLLPAAEPVVGTWRQRLDPAAALGVPAHVTVLYPFLPPSELTDGALDELARECGAQEPFDVELSATGWFGDEVLYAVPEPQDRFRRLTECVVAKWPQCPPYGGEFDEVVPHLTVGQTEQRDALRQAEADVAAGLPVRQRVEAVHLMTGTAEAASWSVVRAFTLGGS
jgi:2'-5' RNA ligase